MIQPAAPEDARLQDSSKLDVATAEKLRAMLSWKYPFVAATERPAKSSVTALRRQAEELDDEAEQIFTARNFARTARRKFAAPNCSAAETGTAHHKFLQHVALENAADVAALELEAERLEREKVLSADERAALDLEDIAAFWSSEPGRENPRAGGQRPARTGLHRAFQSGGTGGNHRRKIRAGIGSRICRGARRGGFGRVVAGGNLAGGFQDG